MVINSETEKIGNDREISVSKTGQSAEYYKNQLIPQLTQEDFENNDKLRAKIFNKERALKDRDLFRPDLKGKD